MDDLRQFIYWIKEERQLSDRTINACISQLRFFTLYVLHKPWDPSQLPINSERSHPFVPEKKNTSPIQISAVSPRLGTILKNHIQSNSVIFQSCSFCLLWIWYFPNELYHMQIEFTNICSTYFQKIVRLAHHWSNENATHSFSKLYPYVFPVTFQKYLKRDCFQPLNFCKFPYRYEQHDNLCPGYL